MRAVIYGAGDDLIEVEGDFSEEYDVTRVQQGSFSLTDDTGAGVRIYVRYEDNGCWSVGLSPRDEDVAVFVPDDWHFDLRPEGKEDRPLYSAVLEITCPDGVTLTWEGGE